MPALRGAWERYPAPTPHATLARRRSAQMQRHSERRREGGGMVCGSERDRRRGGEGGREGGRKGGRQGGRGGGRERTSAANSPGREAAKRRQSSVTHASPTAGAGSASAEERLLRSTGQCLAAKKVSAQSGGWCGNIVERR
eukprot:1501210-Rhodomonas_salina.1